MKSIALKRHFTRAGTPPEENIQWKTFSVPSSQVPVEAPASWSETAVEIAASKYFRQRENETSVRSLFGRVVKAVSQSGQAQGYFASAEQAAIFADELTHILLHQMGSFNSPVYFNVGIFPAFGMAGQAENFVWDGGAARPTTSAYVRPQASACFIQDVQDDLMSIFDLLKNEAKLFKYGSGTGTNFSRLRARGEALVGGGESTGLISYLEIFDKAAQAIKSGGTTRRAAKMVVLDADHPEILEFITWKMKEERKARVLLANGYGGGMEGEAFRTVSGQNSNNSVRVTDAFLRASLEGGAWPLRERRSGRIVQELPAKEIFRAMARAAWECADPGIQFSDTIQKWHTCPNTAPIRSSNPCSEYMFLDNSACNLASLNLATFLREGDTDTETDTETDTDGPGHGRRGAFDFDWAAYAQCVRVLLLAQEILVDYASYPTAEITTNSHRFRPLGLGFANLGGLFMRLAIPYDSDEAERWTAQLTGALHALALSTSAEIAEVKGAFEGWLVNRTPALRVLDQHAAAWRALGTTTTQNLEWVGELYAAAVEKARQSGLRNAQVTLIAPTGTIGLLMDCDTLGIEPDFALVKRKTLAGGGELVLVNQSVREALVRLGYSAAICEEIVAFVRARATVCGAPHIRTEHLAVFDCAIPPGGFPERRISVDGHLRIMAAAQPFLSGAISKTVNLPATATVEDVEELFLKAWRLGLKALAIYRDGSKALQPLCAEC